MNTARRVAVGVHLGLLLITVTVVSGADSLVVVSWWALAVSMLVVVMQAGLNGLWSARTLFTSLVCLFHTGLAIFPVLGLPPQVAGAPIEWLNTGSGIRAMWLASLGVVALGLGSTLIRRPTDGQRNPTPNSLDSRVRELIGSVGFLCVLAGTASWFYFVVSTLGARFIFSSYGAYKAQVADKPMDYVFFSVTLGMLFLGGAAASSMQKIGLICFGLFAVFGFPMGLRGEVLFPLMAFALMRAREHRMPGPKTVVAFALVLLVLIAGVKQMRQVGLGSASTENYGLSPLEGVGELGYTLRTVAAVDGWMSSGLAPRNGSTYAAPLDRAAGRLGVAAPSPPAKVDERLLNVEMRNKEGNIGGSVMAEAHRNFPTYGIFVVMLLAGLLCGLIDVSTSTVRRRLLWGVVFVVLLQHVRNSFTPVPFQLGLGMLVIACVVMAASTRHEAKKPSPSEA